MAKKKIGIYGVLESTANNKVEDLYLIVDESAIAFAVKNNISNIYQCFEYFVNDPENIGWNQLVAYLQNNSKLIQNRNSLFSCSAYLSHFSRLVSTPPWPTMPLTAVPHLRVTYLKLRQVDGP